MAALACNLVFWQTPEPLGMVHFVDIGGGGDVGVLTQHCVRH